TIEPGKHVLSVFASGPVSTLGQAFGVQFARSQYRGQEVTAAISAPHLPQELADLVIGVNGLQPRPGSMTSFDASAGNAPYKPSQVLAAYNANTTGLTGAGQTIAIIIGVFPSASDLTTFFSYPGIVRTGPLPVNVPVGAGPQPGATSGEIALD